MTTKAITRPLHTSGITVMSNITSMEVRGSKITKLAGTADHGGSSASDIYIDLEVEPKPEPSGQDPQTEELGLVLNAADALELGLLLVAMGLEDKTPDHVAATCDRLKALIEDVA
ncbi:MAG: hypothetical protein IGR76_14115 [Synechococcales cyanobacterium T60_A2020_003]|nr:hypothetical protein [Synechococcales cyanobacterium T60_A2020_003]